MKKYAILGYDTINIGDDIQSFVTSTLITPSYIINRDDYDKVYDYETGERVELNEEVYLIMNGWFMHGPEWVGNNKPITGIKFPIKNELIIPIFISTCLPYACKELYEKESLEYLDKYSPILCRDKDTHDKLAENNITSGYFGCLTQLLDISSLDDNEDYAEKYKDSVIFVHGNDLFRMNQINITDKKYVIDHYINDLRYVENPKERLNAAHDLLVQYKYAKKIYTTRLHCFLPCRAMGLDVEYVGETDYRTKELINSIPDKESLKEIFYSKIS